jgi:hypothetical protein
METPAAESWFPCALEDRALAVTAKTSLAIATYWICAFRFLRPACPEKQMTYDCAGGSLRNLFQRAGRIESSHTKWPTMTHTYRASARSFSNADDTTSGFSRGRKCPAPGTISRATSEANNPRSTAEYGGLSATPSFAP